MLEKLLAKLVERARKAPDVCIHQSLERGLHIYLKVDGKGYRLAIARKGGVCPSMQEWNIICSLWPYKLARIPLPRRSQDKHGVMLSLTALIPGECNWENVKSADFDGCNGCAATCGGRVIS